MGHYLYAYLVGQSILKLAWRQVLSYKLCKGSNFVGAQKELEKAYNEMDHQKTQFFLQNLGTDYIKWYRNPPASSHMGGVWERQIRSARAIPNESLRTHLAETEAISNSSSLIVDTFGDMQSEQTILASNIIAMKSKVGLPPPGHFVKADEFLVRLRKEFPWSLQSRHKWNVKHRYFQNVNIVLRC